MSANERGVESTVPDYSTIASSLENENERTILSAGRLGVGGVSAWAANATAEQQTGISAVKAVKSWMDRRSSTDSSFPVSEVITHYRSVGRTRVSSSLVALLQLTARDHTIPHTLRDWLPMTIDQQDGDYDSYIGSPILCSVSAGATTCLPGDITDTLIALQATDLAVIEAAAAASSDTPRSRSRALATARLLSRIPALAPDTTMVRGFPSEHTSTLLATSAPGIHTVVTETATMLLQHAPNAAKQAVDLSFLPVTRLHDEVMFIRCIQIFEGIYRQVARLVDGATRCVSTGDIECARSHLDSASTRIEATPAIYRVLTTMPREAFAVIRDYTHGRSAMQSRPFNEVQSRCARRNNTTTWPTLDETVRTRRERLGPKAAPLVEAMRRLDNAWRSMKRTHWGITLKVIGNVPGTGGTSGADYLRASADIPLFPSLIPDGVRS